MSKNSITAIFLLILAVEFANAIPRSITISGTVMDDPYPMKRMAVPVQGAKIYMWSQIALSEFTSQSTTTADSAVTDATGKFTFKPVQAGSIRIRATHANFTTRQIIFNGTADTSILILLVSKTAHASFIGTVWGPCPDSLDCARQPVAGCNVSVYKAGSLVTNSTESELTSPIISASVYTATTNTSGQYSIDSVPISFNGEKVTVTAAISGYMSYSIDTTLRNMQTNQLDFSLTPTVGLQKDALSVLPGKPTTKDSITFQLFNANLDCFTSYSDQIVQVSDTSIYLSYTYNNTPCTVCACAATGTWTSIKTGPVAAGRYSIYKIGYPYCAAPPCPCYKIAPTWIGTITVVNSTAISAHIGNIPTDVASPRFTVIGGGINAELPIGAAVAIRAFSLRGELLAKLPEMLLPAGSHRIALSSLLSETRTDKPIVMTIMINGVMNACMMILNLKGK